MAVQALEPYYPLSSPDEDKRQILIAKLIHLLDNVGENHKNPLVKSKIRKHEKFVHEQGVVYGDKYYREFLTKLDLQQLDSLLHSIYLALLPHRSENSKTEIALNHVFYNKAIPTAKTTIEDAYNAFGEQFRDSALREDDRQYNLANIEKPDRELEEREFKLLGNPYAGLLRLNLGMLGNDNTQRKYNKIIRDLVDLYRSGKISLLDLQIKLRYSLSKLAITLEQRGLVEEAADLRRHIFNSKHIGISSAFKNKNKVRTKKLKPITQEIENIIQAFIRGLKNTLLTFTDLLGVKLDKKVAPPVDSNIKVTKQVTQVFAALAEKPDPEAERKLLNRIRKLQEAAHALQLAQMAVASSESDEDLKQDLPKNKMELTFAFDRFNKHYRKLAERTLPESPKTYLPKPAY